MNHDQSQQDLAIAVRSALSPLASSAAEPSPFMKTRLLAHFRSAQRVRVSILRWKLTSAVSMFGFVALSLTWLLHSPNGPQFVADNAYVIHLDFKAEDVSSVASAEVLLPENVHFVSGKNPGLKSQKTMRLPLRVVELGRARLPFVVSSTEIGLQTLRVRLYDVNDKLLKEKDLEIRFAKNQGEVAL